MLPSPRRVGVLLRLSLAGLLAAAGAAFAAGATHPQSKLEHAVITIDLDGVYPPLLTIRKDQVVGFLNYSGATAQVVFPDNVADKFRCVNERPSFYREGDGHLVSRPIGSLEFLLPCQLAPGHYRYIVRLAYGKGGIFEGLDPTADYNPPLQMKGEIIVR
jgi:hypothetical protein